MAEKTKETERIYTIPLRSEWLKTHRANRANRSIRAIKHFLKKHTKIENIKISPGLDHLIFSKNIKKPPAKVKVEIERVEEKLIAKLPGEKFERKEEKPKKLAGLRERLTKGKGEREATLKEVKEKTKDESKKEEPAEKPEKEEKKPEAPKEEKPGKPKTPKS